MTKMTLLVVGILLVVMGIVGFIPAWTWANIPQWFAIVKIVIGLVAVYVSAVDKR